MVLYLVDYYTYTENKVMLTKPDTNSVIVHYTKRIVPFYTWVFREVFVCPPTLRFWFQMNIKCESIWTGCIKMNSTQQSIQSAAKAEILHASKCIRKKDVF